jgi:hypothetical protein
LRLSSGSWWNFFQTVDFIAAHQMQKRQAKACPGELLIRRFLFLRPLIKIRGGHYREYGMHAVVT